MISAEDEMTLKKIGVTSGDLVHRAAAYLRERQVSYLDFDQGLPEAERRILDEGGLLGPDENTDPQDVSNQHAFELAAEYGLIVASALSAQKAAETLGVTTSRIRQRDKNGTLYSIDTGSGRVYPRWQFCGDKTLPGLHEVLQAIPAGTHPVAVERFMQTETSDLQLIDEVGTGVSPRLWLAGGHDPRPVCQLAADL